MTEDYDVEDIVLNTKVPDILRVILEKDNDDHISAVAAWNSFCPPDALERVINRGNRCREQNNAATFAVMNDNCPQNLLVKVIDEVLSGEKEDNVVASYAIENKNCPVDILIKILERDKCDGLSEGAIKNPNCPADLKIQYMRKYGKITQEDSNVHIIDKPEVEVDEDLEQLKEMAKGE